MNEIPKTAQEIAERVLAARRHTRLMPVPKDGETINEAQLRVLLAEADEALKAIIELPPSPGVTLAEVEAWLEAQLATFSGSALKLVREGLISSLHTHFADRAQPTPSLTVEEAEVDQFMSDVRAELVRARAKFPGDRIMTIALAEEFGELCKAVLDESAANVRKEAVQTAVMAARVALDGDGSVVQWRQQRGLDALRKAGGA